MAKNSIEVYLSADQKRALAECAAKCNLTSSAFARETLLSAISASTRRTDVALANLIEATSRIEGALSQLEHISAIAIASSVIATNKNASDSPENVNRAKEVIASAISAAPNILKRISKKPVAAGDQEGAKQ